MRPMLDRQVYSRNAELITAMLDAAGITWWWVDPIGHRGRRVIACHHRDALLVREALVQGSQSSDNPASWRITNALARRSHTPVTSVPEWADLLTADDMAWRVGEVLVFEGTGRELGLGHGCDLEFWRTDPHGRAIAPRENRAARVLDKESSRLVVSERDGRTVRLPAAFDQTFIDDVTFPIDAVYTWVDGDDPAWRARRAPFAQTSAGAEHHAEATHEARFRSRDELRYSLRSLDDFAPWIRRIFLVTDQQVPSWLRTDHERITVIDHRDIFPDDGRLPVFNSNAIIGRLHRIEGLSEHFLFFNDDVMLARPVHPQQFFLGSGIALVSPSNNRRPFIVPAVTHEPHINLTANIRALMFRATARTASRAIKHTPHPLLRSVLAEQEEIFAEEYEATSRSRFRHHNDIVADQLHHYYAQATGRAVPGSLRYTYINVLDDSFISPMEDLLRRRDRDAMCINDAPVPGSQPMPPEAVATFLQTYFPAPSQFEVNGA